MRTLKQLLIKFEIKSVSIIKDLGMLSTAEWSFLIDQINKICKGIDICIVLFKNNLPVPRVEDRYRLIKEYHESATGGHKGMTKTYDKLAHEYYWKAMQADVRQFVRGCSDCQVQKLVRIKTKLPMIINDTPARPFSKISIDFVGPKEPTSAEN